MSIEPVTVPEYERVNGSDIYHGFFTRKGGVSEGIYHSLNCGRGSNDAPENVHENLARVQSHLDAKRLYCMIQTHSANCEIITSENDPDNRPEADALATDTPGLALGVLTADCGPVLLAGRKSSQAPVIGAAHAGWGGAVRGILEATIEKMEHLGAIRSTIAAVIGPSIQQASYEVGPEFFESFVEKSLSNEQFFKSGRAGKYHFDLQGYIAARLAKAGCQKVFISDLDTYKDERRFFSYRRATHRIEPDYGRQISTVMIND